MANIIVFINAHLAFNNANKVAVVASHSQRADWLYPSPPNAPTSTASNGQPNGNDVRMADGNEISAENVNGNNHASNNDASNPPPAASNKYAPFATIESIILSNLRTLISSTTLSDLDATYTTAMAGAFSLVLSYISRQSRLYSGDKSADDERSMQSRILVVSVSGDLSGQYIPVMNSIFAAQRLHVPIDILKLAGDSVFLQQASDATKGIYMDVRPPPQGNGDPRGILQYLMMSFLPDQTCRKHLILPTQVEVDFRAACFCHRRVVDVGFVCSVCLSSKYSLNADFIYAETNNVKSSAHHLRTLLA
jgi:transcription initiation factor TFIIH subunit 3